MSTLTESKLTVTQLETAAADLRNAALVVDHVGHTRRKIVDFRSGAVCALGAIELATARRLDYANGEYGTPWTSDAADANLYRRDNAVIAFADFIPSELCETCTAGACDCGCNSGWMDEYGKVTHYNDEHCISGALLVGMLRTAADRALDAVAERRALLVGDRLPVLV